MKILVADDHELIQQGISLFLQSYQPAAVRLQARSLPEVLDAVQAHTDIDLILLDLVMPGMHGPSSIEQIRQASPATPLAILSAHDDPLKIRTSLQAGAQGFIPKSLNREAMRHALDCILSGGIYTPARALPDDDAGPPQLTPRQYEILQLLAGGMSNKEIGQQLALSPATVRTHLSAIFQRLGVKNRTQAASQLLGRDLDTV